MLLWSTGFIGARYAMPYAEPFTFLALRYALALAVLVALSVAVSARMPARGQAVHSMIAGSLIHGVYLGGVFYAVRHGLNAGIAALIVGLQPILTTFLASFILGDRVRPRHVLGLALGLAGIAMVIFPKLGAGGTIGVRTLFPVFASALGISLGTIWQKRFVSGVDLRTGTAFQYLGAVIPTAILASFIETQTIAWTGELVFALAWLTLVLSIGAIFLMMVLIREGAVSSVAALMYLTPGVTAIMAFLLFDETLTLLQLCGLVVAATGVAVSTREWKRRQVPPTA
ncbi:DMT family transporter [Fulvimarina sp. 2208YS6-2-32]|uniref:DMT family transporter n=1 Tax=Fulvimarina uroteuthidis TaxID=3098149 RepID=A0ABU5HX15_9HYPH|nr:DMT family transporter [Fulvimarina sp. 2208YS6-2-32]MDY8107687.1 DMT family transporter [Fulvimarina sp. 2208YS6-2-32]